MTILQKVLVLLSFLIGISISSRASYMFDPKAEKFSKSDASMYRIFCSIFSIFLILEFFYFLVIFLRR